MFPSLRGCLKLNILCWIYQFHYKNHKNQRPHLEFVYFCKYYCTQKRAGITRRTKLNWEQSLPSELGRSSVICHLAVSSKKHSSRGPIFSTQLSLWRCMLLPLSQDYRNRNAFPETSGVLGGSKLSWGYLYTFLNVAGGKMMLGKTNLVSYSVVDNCATNFY